MVAPTSAGAAQVHDIVAMTAPSLVLAPASLFPDPGSDPGPTPRWLPIEVVGDARAGDGRRRRRPAIPTSPR